MAQQPIDQSQLDATINAQSLQGQTIGSGANQIVQRDGSGNIDADSINGLTVGTGATQIVQRDGLGNIPEIIPNYENQSGVAGNTTVINTTVNTIAAAGGKANLQVFINGILQIESDGFTVTGANQITLVSPPSTTFTVTIFSWR